MTADTRSTHDTQMADEVAAIRASADRWRLVFGATLLLMSALIWGAWIETSAYERSQNLEATAHRQTNLAIATEHYVVRVLRSTDAIANFLAAAHLAAPSDEALQLAMASRVRINDILSAIGICFTGGTWVTTQALASGAQAGGGCPQWAAAAAGGRDDARIAPAIAIGDDTTVPLTYVLDPAPGRPGGVLVMFVNVRRLLGLLEDYRIPEDTSVAVIGADGQPRARWNSREQTIGQRAPEAAMLDALRGRPPGSVAVDAQGQTRLGTLRMLTAYPLGIIVSTSEADAMQEFRSRTTQYAWACAIASVVLAALFLLLLRMHNRSVRMAESLGRAREKLSTLNAELELEVHARTRELEDAYRDLEAFTYTVAHDVRAPIASIRGFAGVVLPAVERSGDERMAHYMRRIVANATQMNDLTESLLELGKLTRAPVMLVPVDLSAMSGDVVASLRENERSERHVDADVQPDVHVMADRVLLRQVMENLLGNAWKFTSRRSDARIRVHAVRDAVHGHVTVTVSDNGAGFDTGKSGDLFKPFHRMHAVAEFPGSGVGLATVQRILRLHGGRIWIESAEGQGTSVHFTLQHAPQAPQEPQAQD